MSETHEPKEVKYLTAFPLQGSTFIHTGYIYKLCSKDDCYTFRNFADSLDKFVLRHSKKNNMIIWDKAIPNMTLHVVKAYAVFRNTPETRGAITPRLLYDMLQDSVYRQQWDQSWLEAFRVVRMNESNDIGYYAAKSPVPLMKNRDFVNQRTWHDAGRGEYIIFNTSVPHNSVPPNYQKAVNRNKYGSCIRAFSYTSGYFIQPYVDPATGKEDGTALIFITQSDPAGWVPQTLTNLIASKYAPNMINNVQHALVKFCTWLPEQIEKNKYVKDWDTPQEWWISEEAERANPTRSLTAEFVQNHWKAH